MEIEHPDAGTHAQGKDGGAGNGQRNYLASQAPTIQGNEFNWRIDLVRHSPRIQTESISRALRLEQGFSIGGASIRMILVRADDRHGRLDDSSGKAAQVRDPLLSILCAGAYPEMLLKGSSRHRAYPHKSS
jgi:hypothetical protein